MKWYDEYVISIYGEEFEFIKWKLDNGKELSPRDCNILRDAIRWRKVLKDMDNQLHKTEATL